MSRLNHARPQLQLQRTMRTMRTLLQRTMRTMRTMLPRGGRVASSLERENAMAYMERPYSLLCMALVRMRHATVVGLMVSLHQKPRFQVIAGAMPVRITCPELCTRPCTATVNELAPLSRQVDCMVP